MRAIVPPLLLALAGGAVLTAQAPPGLPIIAAFNPGPWNPAHGQTGGLFVLDPRTPGNPTPVAGLPLELTGQNLLPTGFDGGVGADSALALSDGDLLVGEAAMHPSTLPGSPQLDNLLEVHRIRLLASPGGWTASIVASYPIATLVAGGVGGVSDLELLAGNQILVSLIGAFTAPMTGVRLAVLDLATSTVTPIPVSGLVGEINALAIDVRRQTVYLGEFRTSPPVTGRVSTLTLPLHAVANTATALTAAGSIPGGILALDLDEQGQLLAGTLGASASPPWGAPPTLHSVDPASGVVTNVLATAPEVRNALLVERNTGVRFLGMGLGISYHVPGTPSEVPLVTSAMPSGPGWGVPSGIALVPALAAFGAQTGGAAPYEWRTEPNPGGLPQVGNSGFSITIDTSAAPALGLVAFALLPAAPWVHPIGFTAVLDPTSLLGGWLFAAGGPAPFAIPLPLPNNPVLARTAVHAQTFHVDGAGYASSPGLRIAIL